MMLCTTIAEIEADFFEDDNSIDLKWCVENANFEHVDACEFIIHVGSPSDILSGNDTIFENNIKSMKEFGCTQEFIHCYQAAKEAGATRVLFYA